MPLLHNILADFEGVSVEVSEYPEDNTTELHFTLKFHAVVAVRRDIITGHNYTVPNVLAEDIAAHVHRQMFAQVQDWLQKMRYI